MRLSVLWFYLFGVTSETPGSTQPVVTADFFIHRTVGADLQVARVLDRPLFMSRLVDAGQES